jgi:hypothetical protein
MRDREAQPALFDDLEARGNIILHGSGDEAWAAITRDVSERAAVGASVAVAVATNEQAAELNALVQATHANAGRTRKPATEVAGTDGLTLRVGDRLMTRQNDTELGVANRDTWTVERVHRDGSVSVSADARKARLPRDYVQESTHLAYASTEYGVQGATVDYGHGVVTDSSSAQAVYVAATRGREHNTLHIVAGDRDEARGVFVAATNREAGDRGTGAARVIAHRDVEGVVLPQLDYDPQLRAVRLAAEERAYLVQLRTWQAAQQRWETSHPDLSAADYPAALTKAEDTATETAAARKSLEHATAANAIAAGQQQWGADYAAVHTAETEALSASVLRRAAAQKEAESALRRFQSRHKAAATSEPGESQRSAWARVATAPGASVVLDDARAVEAAAIAHLAKFHANPAPSSGPLTAPARNGAAGDRQRRGLPRAPSQLGPSTASISRPGCAPAAAKRRQVAGPGAVTSSASRKIVNVGVERHRRRV